MSDPRRPLDPGERALAAQLPRLHGRGEPDPALDARILAAARTAVAPRPVLRPRLRWIAPMAVAASLSLAVGLAWRLRPPPAPEASPPMAETAVTEMPAARLPVPTPSPDHGRALNSPPMPTSSSPPVRQAPASDTPAHVPMQPVAAATPPPAPPAPPAAAPVAAAESAASAEVATAPRVAPVSSPAMAKAGRSAEGERGATSAGATPQSQSNQAAQAADAGARDPQAFSADDPGEDVPPATVDSPEVRDAWLRRIGELRQEGRSDEARASLAEFRRRYPDAPVPPELRTLEP